MIEDYKSEVLDAEAQALNDQEPLIFGQVVQEQKQKKPRRPEQFSFDAVLEKWPEQIGLNL